MNIDLEITLQERIPRKFWESFNRRLCESFGEDIIASYKEDGIDNYTGTPGWEEALENTCTENGIGSTWLLNYRDNLSWQETEDLDFLMLKYLRDN